MSEEFVRIGMHGTWYPEHGTLYVEGGKVSLPRTKHRDAAVSLVKQYEDNGLLPCCDCGIVMTKTDVAGSRFAGRYCPICWAKYQKANSQKCLICSAPRWRCCC